jgi:class 3 adenylate cyclase
MDMALKEHHTVMRRVIREYGGYESSTEGDSFIVAFHNAFDALSFARTVQLELLKVTWPHELMERSPCEPVWVRQTG